MKTGLPKNDSAGGQGALRSRSPSPLRRSRTSGALATFFVRRERWTLTWPGRLLTLAVLAMLTVVGARSLCGFLAITSPVGGQFLVVEGWMPTYAYREAAAQFRKGSYRKIIAAGVLQEDGNAGGDLREHFGGEKLINFGVPSDLVVTASYGEIHRDRTFHSAMAVKQWLHDQGLQTVSIDVVTVGPHARRSRLLYEKALGDAVNVGVIAIEDRRFDPNHWWRSSEGVRTIVDESIAYLYARVFFSTPE
jgi:uncharacterized SAM-binding protein YcdF (DUF218 family)